MATAKQRAAASKNIKKAQRASRSGRSGHTEGASAQERSHPPDSSFAFPKQRKEPLTDAAHVRNAIARFDQVEGVSDADRDEAWNRILAAAGKHGVDVNERSWHELMAGGTSGG